MGTCRMRWTYAAKTAKNEKNSLVERWLRHRYAKGVLISLLVVSALLFSTTSSIYLTNDGPSDETVKVTVQTADGLDFSPRHELTTSATKGKLDGGLLFLIPPPGELKFRLEEPVGWSLRANQSGLPRPWRSVNLLVSRDFVVGVKPEPGILRLVPRSTLMQFLPKKSGGMNYELHVKVNGVTYVVPHLHKGVVWLGGPVARLKEFIANEKPSDRQVSLNGCLISGESPNSMMDLWGSSDILLETPIIKSGDTVSIEVIGPVLPSKMTLPTEKILDGTISTECL